MGTSLRAVEYHRVKASWVYLNTSLSTLHYLPNFKLISPFVGTFLLLQPLRKKVVIQLDASGCNQVDGCNNHFLTERKNNEKSFRSCGM